MTEETIYTGSPTAGAPHPSVKIDASYAMITFGSTVIWSMVSGWLLYFYLAPEGKGTVLVPAALYSTVILVTRLINAAITPPIGYLSDHTRSRWGRRLPYMAASALPLLILFTLLWTPPVQGESIWNLVYLGSVLLLYNVAYVFNQVPYMALLPEIATTDHHRVRISAWNSSSLLIAMIVGGLAGPLIERVGYAATALIYAAISLPLFYLPFLVLKEDTKFQPTEIPERINVLHEFGALFKNHAFVIMITTWVLYWSTTTFFQSIVPYIVTEICELTIGDTLYFYIPGVLGSLACYPLVTWLAKKYGKWAVFAGSLLASAFVLPWLMAIGQWFPLPLSVQGIIWITLQAIAMSGVTMLPTAFIAEVANYDTQLTGQHREGTYYAMLGVLDQVINGAAAALLPMILLLGRSRLDPQGPLGVRLIGVIGGTMMFVGFLVFLNYPLRYKENATTKDSLQIY